jgi:hypothetical protein
MLLREIALHLRHKIIMEKTTKIFVFFYALVLLLLSSEVRCQIVKLCPKADKLDEKWSFVNCQTQQQVLPYVYVQVGNINNNYEEEDDGWGGGSGAWGDEKCLYFWSKFALDSLSIIDNFGTVIFKASKQKFPLIEEIKFVNDEFFQLLWSDTLQADNLFGFGELNMSMFIDKKGNKFKPNNISNISVREIRKVGLNYIVYFRRLDRKKNQELHNYILIDKEGKPLSRVYRYMQLVINKELIEVQNDKIGFIDLQGKVIIPVEFNNSYSGYNSNKFIILRKESNYGVLDKKGKVVLPFKYHKLRQIGNTLFVAQDVDNIDSEYVINTEQKILTKPVFYSIRNFSNDTVYQSWNKAILAYDTNGNCISSKEEQEQKELFMLFIKDIKTNKLHKLANLNRAKSDEVELVFISPNYYQYKSQAVKLSVPRWYPRPPVVIDKINFSTGQRFKYINFQFQITEIQMLNTQTDEKISLQGKWAYEVNTEW